MATWRDNPEIMAARDYCKQFGRHAVVVVSYSKDGYHLISYGSNGPTCQTASKCAEAIGDLLESGQLPYIEET